MGAPPTHAATRADRGRRLAPLLCLGALLAWVSTGAASLAQNAEGPVFATVGDQVVSLADYQAALQQGVRARYYHGKVPEGELARFQREVGEKLVTRTLLLQEAERRGLEPDRDWVQARLDGYERRYAGNPRWESEKDKLLPAVGRALETESKLERLERQVRETAPPGEAELRAFYAEHRDKFVEPERFRVSAILLRVDPSSGTAVWDAAKAEAAEIVAQLRAGADFAEIARLRSGDASAAQGGDMGYLHRGMLGEAAEQVIDTLAPGELSEPVVLLEGVAVFRLEDRLVPRRIGFEEVRDRARDLWMREQGEAAWQELLSRLRASTAITVNEQHYLPLPAEESGKDEPESKTH